MHRCNAATAIAREARRGSRKLFSILPAPLPACRGKFFNRQGRPNHTMNQPVILPLAALRRSKTNPRTVFDETKLRELGADLQKGFLMPLIVRPLWCLGCASATALDAARPATWDGAFEIVDGERRFRACGPKFANIGEVPCDIREFTDVRVVEVQLITYLLKEALTPLEEGKGFSDLAELADGEGKKLHTAETLAASVHREPAYVYSRMKLLSLPKKSQGWLASGKIGVALGDIIARIPTPQMREAAEAEILSPGGAGEPMSTREAEQYVKDHFMRQLKGAHFDTADAELLPAAGSCTACPKRTGNNKLLFGDAKRGDICTDPACYAEKCARVFARAAAKVKDTGAKVLAAKESAALFAPHDGTTLVYDGKYVDVDTKPAAGLVRAEVEDAKLPTWARLIEGQGVQTLLAQDRSGRVRTLVDREIAITAAKENGEKIFVSGVGHAPTAAASPAAAADKAQKAAQQRKELLTLASARALYAAMVTTAKPKWTTDVGEVVMWLAFDHAGADGAWFVLKRRGIKKPVDRTTEETLTKELHRLAPEEWTAQAIELLYAREIRFNGVEKNESFQKLAKLFGVDLAKVKAEALATPKAALAAVTPPKKPAAKARAAKKLPVKKGGAK